MRRGADPSALAAFLLLALAAGAWGGGDFRLPGSVRQCVLAIAETWQDSRAEITLHELRGGQWQRAAGPWPARLGKNGLAWGLGMHLAPAKGLMKREGDGRAPAGVFRIGGAWGDAPDIHRNPRLPYTRVTSRDLWVEDPSSPFYNQHVRLDYEPASAWEKKQRMKQKDPAHALKAFIAHNAGAQPEPGAGSAIFFHIWRAGGGKASSGCTTLAEDHLRQMIAWLDPAASPVFVLLPRAEYERLRGPWGLP